MPDWKTRVVVLWPGLLMAALVGMAAVFLANHYGAPVMLFALMLGMAVNFLSEEGRCRAGIEFTAKQVLRWGVGLLGLQITAAQVQAMGWEPVAVVVLSVVATIVFGITMANSAAFPNRPLRDRATLCTVISGSTLSTVAMVLHPWVVRWLGLDAVHA